MKTADGRKVKVIDDKNQPKQIKIDKKTGKRIPRKKKEKISRKRKTKTERIGKRERKRNIRIRKVK